MEAQVDRDADHAAADVAQDVQHEDLAMAGTTTGNAQADAEDDDIPLSQVFRVTTSPEHPVEPVSRSCPLAY